MSALTVTASLPSLGRPLPPRPTCASSCTASCAASPRSMPRPEPRPAAQARPLLLPLLLCQGSSPERAFADFVLCNNGDSPGDHELP
uniref:Uncharacterized protein n=1 Tax=Arundo donax TaxID=35708 RepID=A0A0A9B7Z9_ARUDO